MADKRRTPRIQPFVAPCHVVEGSRRFLAYVTDLSLQGARVACDEEPPAPEAWVTLEVRLPRHVGRSPLPGRVKWVQPPEGRGGHAFGVTFEGGMPDGARELAAVLDEFQRLAAELGREEGVGMAEDGQARRKPWSAGPDAPPHDARGWLALTDDDLLFRIEGLGEGHDMDDTLLEVIRSARHFFIRQEAAKKVRDHHLLKEHSSDRHIGQILVRGLNRGEDVAYLEKLLAESRHIEVKKAAEAQLRLIEKARKDKQ